VIIGLERLALKAHLRGIPGPDAQGEDRPAAIQGGERLRVRRLSTR